MAVHMISHLRNVLPELRVLPVTKWIRASVGDELVVSTRAAMVVWEPRRLVPSYAVPRSDVAGDLFAHELEAGVERPVRIGSGGLPLLDPRTPFTVHSCSGESLSIRTSSRELTGAAFAPDDPDLDGYVILDWAAFTEWREEDETVVGHPHDPFARIDCLPSSRRVTVSLGGRVLADTSRPTLLFETPLPVRYYIPVPDVRMDHLVVSDTHTVCAYKGTASYWSLRTDGQDVPDIAWSYPAPLHDALPVRDLVAFFTERLDLEVDGERITRPITPWS